MLKLKLNGVDGEILNAVSLLCDEYDFALSSDGLNVDVKNVSGSDVIVTLKDSSATIVYDKKSHFFRALGLLIEGIRDGEKEINISQKPRFTSNGPMFDVSQGNATINLKSIKKVIRQLAVMGMDTLMLYCEDSFEIKSEPYFGYMRSKYSYDEIKELDDYAFMFGIELVPCVQTLAHLPDALKWACYREYREDHECLLVGDERTYALIRKILTDGTAPFRTKKVHIGMDEAWRLGRGQYLTLNGYVDPIKIMEQHLEKVMEIVNELGLEPMMWSDMFFRPYSPNGNGYYIKEALPQSVIDMVPDNLRLIYWDYYNHEQEVYDNMAAQHSRFKAKPVFAGGVWTWVGYAPHWDTTFVTTERALRACKNEGITDILATVWGDAGTECLFNTSMLGIALFAEAGYCEELDYDYYKKRFEFCTGANYDDLYALMALDRVPSTRECSGANPAKYLMWQDVLTGLFDKNIEGLELSEHYSKLHDRLLEARGRNGWYNGMIEMNIALSDALSVKAEAGLKLTKAYKDGDKAALIDMKDNYLPTVIEKIKKLRLVHFDCWLELYKPIGWDIIDMRYGSIIARIDSAIRQIGMYLDGKLEKIEELEQERLLYNGQESLPHQNYFGKTITSSRIVTVL